jgi:glycosyl transferase, family 25
MNLENIQVLVISLMRSIERREKVSQEMAKTNLSWNFLDAVDGRRVDFPIAEYPEKKVKSLLGFGLSPGEIGAALSHKIAWRMCCDANQVTLVLEDDFVLLPQFEQTLEIVTQGDQGWNLLRLQALTESPFVLLQKHNSVSIVKNEVDPLGCTAYLLTPKAASILLANFEQIYEPIDHFLEHEEKHGIQFLAAREYPVTISGEVTTVLDRPERKPLRGYRKIRRSLLRFLDRRFSSSPWFPK